VSARLFMIYFILALVLLFLLLIIFSLFLLMLSTLRLRCVLFIANSAFIGELWSAGSAASGCDGFSLNIFCWIGGDMI
jgi:hypothetical protein